MAIEWYFTCLCVLTHVFPTSLKEGSTGFDSNTFFPAPKKSAGKPATPIMVQKYKGNGILNLLPIVIIIRRWHQFGNTYPPFLPPCKTQMQIAKTMQCTKMINFPSIVFRRQSRIQFLKHLNFFRRAW
jgi:hypothetical protein